MCDKPNTKTMKITGTIPKENYKDLLDLGFDGKIIKTDSLDNIMIAVCLEQEVTLSEILTGSQVRRVSNARHLFCKVAQYYGYVLQEIGKYLGRDHASIINSLYRCDENLEAGYTQTGLL